MILKFFASIILLFFNIASQSQNLNLNSVKHDRKYLHDSVCIDLKILNIERIKHAHIIDAVDLKNNHYYTIVSLKKINFSFRRVKEGKSYVFLIYPYFYPNNYVPTLGLTYVLEIDSKVIAVPSRSWMNNVYLTKNLKGLSYIRNQSICPDL